MTDPRTSKWVWIEDGGVTRLASSDDNWVCDECWKGEILTLGSLGDNPCHVCGVYEKDTSAICRASLVKFNRKAWETFEEWWKS